LPAATQPVVIVGGGISGLTAAYKLQQSGISHLLIEKRPRLGGVIETRQWEGCVLECGPDSFISQKPEALALIKELGMESDVIGSNDRERATYIQRQGRLVRLPEGTTMFVPTQVMPMLGSPIVSWNTKWQMAREFFRKPTHNKDRSVAEFVTDHFGQETLDYLAEPLLSGVYGGDVHRLSMASVMPRFVEMERTKGSLAKALIQSRTPRQGQAPPPLFRTLKRGLGSLTDKLSTYANVQRAEAQALRQLPEGGWEVRVDGDWIGTSNVILACPAWSAARLLGTVDGVLARALEMTPYTSSAVVTLIYNAQQFDGQKAGTGFLIPRIERTDKERHKMMACTFVGTKFPHRVPKDKLTLRCFFGSVGNENVLSQSDDSLIAQAGDELRRIIGLTTVPIHALVARWDSAMAQYTIGHADRLQEIRARAAANPGLYLAGNAYTGIGIPDCIRMGCDAAQKIRSGA
jgi:protoporphyrinogen/coproporphyrinogen III oxidase